MRAWRMPVGVIIAIVEPRSKVTKGDWPSFFLELSKILENTGAPLHVEVFQPSPSRLIMNSFMN